MGFRINTNINAIDTQRNLMMTGTNMATTMRRLSSGLRINSAADDAAGLAISQKLNAQVQGLNQAVRNAQDGISLVQTGEGALNETQSILQRMRQLAVQSANDTNTQTDRTAIQSEMNQLATEMSRISNTTSFNTKNLLAGGFKNQSLQIGANAGENMSFSINAMDAASLGVAGNGASVSSTKNSANIQTVTGVGSGYANAVNYTINSQALSAGSLTDAVGTATNTGANQGQNIGTESMSSAWASTTAPTNFVNGDSVTMNGFTSRVSGVSADGKNVTQVQIQQAGSTSWSTVNGVQQSNGSYKFNVAASFTDTTAVASGTINMVYSFTNGATAPHVGDQFSQAAVTGPITVAAGSITAFGAATSFNTTSAANNSGAIAVSAGQNQGNESLNVAGAFAGSSTTNYLMKVTGVSATSPSQVSSVQFSTDGGSTWANASATLQNNGSYSFTTQQSSSGGATGSGGDSGMTFSFNAPLNMVPPAIGDTFNLQAVAGTTSSGAAGTATNIGLGTVGTGGNDSTFSVSGTYKGSLAGAVSIVTSGAVTSATGLTAALVTGVKVGGVTLDKSQYSFTAGNVLQLDGLSISVSSNNGTGLAAGTNNITSIVTPESVGQSANLAGAASVTFGNTAGTVPTMGATVTSQATSQAAVTGGLASGQSLTGLGAGSLLLKYTGGGTNTLQVGYNGVNNAGPGFSAGVSTTVAGGSNTISVTGADSKTYKVALSNVTATGATVSIQDNAATPNTLSTFTVAFSSLGSTNDGMAINLSPYMLNTNTADTLNANNANNPVVATTNLGAEQASVSGTYNGTTNQQFTAKVTSLDSYGNATQIQVSTDGGKTYGSTISSTNTPTASSTQTSFSLGNGLTFNVTPGQANQNSTAVGDTFGFLATASAANGGTGTNLLQLQYTDANSKTYNMGAGALLQAGQTSTQLGAGSMAMTANFGAYGSAGSVGNGSTTITSQGSAAATIGANDFVVSNAIAYAGLDVTSQANAQAAISTIDTAINTVSLQRAQMGAIQNRLQHTINNLSVGSENLSAAQSRIQDVDVAAETVNMTKNQILTQAGISVLSQANQQPQMVMKLLQ